MQADAQQIVAHALFRKSYHRRRTTDVRRREAVTPKFPLVKRWIQTIRHDLGGWSLVDISKSTGLEYGLLRKWSAGINKPEWENTLTLCHLHHTALKAKHTSVKMLTDGQSVGIQSNIMTARDDFEALLLEKFRALSTSDRVKLLETIGKEMPASQQPAAPQKR